MRRSLYKILGYLILGCHTVWSEPLNSEALKFPPLPDVRNAQTNPVTIDAESVSLYRELLFPEITAWIERGDLLVNAARAPREEYILGENKEEAVAVGTCATLPAVSNLVTQPAGAIFSKAEIAQCRDPQDKGVRLLWNTYSTQWALGALRYDFDLFIFPDKQIVRRFAGNLVRLFPRAFPQHAKLNQISREIITLDSPDLLKGYRWLTFRLGTADEDAVWINSPAIKKVRQLTDSNRGDPLFRGAATPDDFFTWSQKPQGLAVDRVEERLLLLPLFEDVFDLSTTNGSCHESQSKSAQKKWNFQSSKVAGVSGWNPSAALWSLRKVFVVSGRVIDPYYSLGYESVVIDSETMLPVIRVGFDRLGKLSRTSLGIISALEISADGWTGPKRLPMILDVIVKDELNQHVSVISASKYTVCEKSEAPFDLQSFDPTHFAAETINPSATKIPNKLPVT